MTKSTLGWTAFASGLENLQRAPILLFGAEDAVLIDGGFTLSNGRLLVDKIEASNKSLRSIFITCADPDYYFGLGPVCAAFPDAAVVAADCTAAVIAETVAHKVDVWRDHRTCRAHVHSTLYRVVRSGIAQSGEYCNTDCSDARTVSEFGDGLRTRIGSEGVHGRSDVAVVHPHSISSIVEE